MTIAISNEAEDGKLSFKMFQVGVYRPLWLNIPLAEEL